MHSPCSFLENEIRILSYNENLSLFWCSYFIIQLTGICSMLSIHYQTKYTDLICILNKLQLLFTFKTNLINSTQTRGREPSFKSYRYTQRSEEKCVVPLGFRSSSRATACAKRFKRAATPCTRRQLGTQKMTITITATIFQVCQLCLHYSSTQSS